ncbi:MAG: THUMP-like domain-containing protein [Propioniciclava sp.]
MDPELARWLVSPEAAGALTAADGESDPRSLAAATRMRRLVSADRAAAVLNQVDLRRRAVGKFGARAAALFFTSTGLEQATRAAVARRRAERFAAHTRTVADLGCGLGADALALLDAGVRVTAIEADQSTAILAAANLQATGGPALVRVADAVDAWEDLRGESGGVFCDPGRRSATGRSWRVEDLSPPWDFARGLLDGSRLACVKLGPGVDRGILPAEAEVEWVSDARSVVECAAWAGPGSRPGRRVAVVDGAELEATGRGAVEPSAPAAYLWEPDGAVIRARAVDDLAVQLNATRIDPGVAYLTSPTVAPTPFARAFRIRDVLPWDEKTVRGWLRHHRVGVLEIKKRGINVDPATVRRRLKPQGPESATLVLTPSPRGALAIVCEPISASLALRLNEC